MSGVRSSATAPANTRVPDLVALFKPRAIAVVGVSRHRRGLGRRILAAVEAAGFPGHVFAVTHAGGDLDGRPTWPSVTGLPEPVDLAIVAVPRDAVPAVIDDCIAAGVLAVVVISAGFAEADAPGRALQAELVAKVRRAGIRLVGPNCMGVLNTSPDRPMNASFSPIFPPAGGLAMSSQSGALGIVILDLASRRHVGLSSFVSVGNKADVSSNDLIEYWASDPATSVIALYLESFGNPRRFAQIARRVARRKPIIAVKSGRTRAGAAAAGSHTAAMAASDIAVSALFHQTGVIRADTIDEMFDLAACLEAQPLPSGERVAIVTNAGGPGILAADASTASGLTVVPFAEATRARLTGVLPSLVAPTNPLDMIATAGPDHYRAAIAAVLAADEVDALVVLYTPVDAADAAATLDAIRAGIVAGRASAKRAKPVLACLMADGGHPRLSAGAEQIPIYAFPENAIRALGKIARYAKWRNAAVGERPAFDDLEPRQARALCQSVIAARGADWLTSEEAMRLLAAFGIVLTPAVPVRSAAEAVQTAEAIGLPVVAKLVSPHALHKSDVGGVQVDLKSGADIVAAFERLTETARQLGIPSGGVRIQPMVAGGVEAAIGITNDPVFGSLVGFGSGGVDIEVHDDMHFRVSPLSDMDVRELMAEPRVARLLGAHRGRPPADTDALFELLARVSRLAEEVPEVLELDLNPVIVRPAGQGCHIVDVRVRVGA